jgi:hypothetical protein
MRTPPLPSPLPLSLRLTLLAVAACAALAPEAARASLVLALDTPTMVERADAIAVVDVAAARAAWDDRHERIVSTVDLTVVESWKGAASAGARIQVVQPGGTVGDLTMVVFGMPHFAPGERALVFLRGPAGHAAVVGMAQGKRLVRRDAARGSFVIAAPDRAGASFVGAAPTGARVPALETGTRSFEEVRAEIRALVLRGGAR